jgi:TonB family protein
MVMNTFVKSAVFLIVFWADAYVVFAQGRLVGRVLGNDKKPVIAATVYVVGEKFTQATITNAYGYFTFFEVPIGPYQLKAYKRGLPLLEKIVQVNNGLSRIDITTTDQIAALGSPEKSVKRPKPKPPAPKRTTEKAEENSDGDEATKTSSTNYPSKESDAAEQETEPPQENTPEVITEQDLAKEEGLKESFESAKAVLETEKIKVDKRPEIVGGMPALNSKIMYPSIAREKGVQGAVIARVNVDKDGRIAKVTIVKSSDPSFSEEVFRVLSDDVKFQPALLNNQPVASAATILVEFKLQ